MYACIWPPGGDACSVHHLQGLGMMLLWEVRCENVAQILCGSGVGVRASKL